MTETSFIFFIFALVTTATFSSGWRRKPSSLIHRFTTKSLTSWVTQFFVVCARTSIVPHSLDLLLMERKTFKETNKSQYVFVTSLKILTSKKIFWVCMRLLQLQALLSQACCKMLWQDTRLQLPIQHLRAHTYDSAGNMAGKYKGCQAELKRIQPLATYVHCSAHVSHLVTSKCLQTAPFIRDAVDLVQELENLYKSWSNFKNLYLNLHSDDADCPSPSRLKPIAQHAGWRDYLQLCQCSSNYKDILAALEEAAAEFGSSTASMQSERPAFQDFFRSNSPWPSCNPAHSSCLEAFNRGLQGSSVTVLGMMEVADVTRSMLSSLRNDDRFGESFSQNGLH